MQASSIPRWIAALGLGLMSILMGATLLEISIKYAAGSNSLLLQPTEFRKWWTSGFDTSNSSRYLIDYWQLSTLDSLVVANTPQLVLTLSYYFYNGVLTNMLAAAEYSSYAVHRRPLRVTFPVRNSGQRSTHWLSIPHTYSIPVVLAYMLLHWMVSQSLYYEQTVPYDLSDRPDRRLEISSLGYAPLPIFLALLIAAIMLCVLMGIGCRRVRSQMPLASSNSGAISAACHPPKGEALGTAVVGPVSWGVGVQWEGRETGHCSFSSLKTEQPCATREYC
ncbi:hypothetical protein N7474_009727 [Penicillium riverlandense]|uniref:uncharacterized protein n=1 Tax=Penicillium riverlandense TaxID=1903569 RepID=UPI002548587D|nr:uncharacterized protein N7474_009727 [Penicillium riverlandense]KAJ5808458.1 hypothetical protein N7474_009727 [Penicillium riverlandense]